jgi:hypothetical protein
MGKFPVDAPKPNIFFSFPIALFEEGRMIPPAWN